MRGEDAITDCHSNCCCKCYAGQPRLISAAVKRHGSHHTLKGWIMIFLGVVLMVIGFIASIPILWTVGIILLIVGIVLELMGMAGHAVAGRRHYY